MTQRSKREAAQHSLHRYVLTGAGLGLYFGLFFQPARAMNLSVPFTLGVVGALLMVLLNLRRPEGRSLRAALRHGLWSWLALTLTLLVLEARHPVYDAAGRTGTALFTAAAGALAGFVYARRERKRAP